MHSPKAWHIVNELWHFIMIDFLKNISNFFLLFVFYSIAGMYILQIFELLVPHGLENKLFLQT